MPRRNPHVGNVYHHRKVIKIVGRDGRGVALYEVVCLKCGRRAETVKPQKHGCAGAGCHHSKRVGLTNDAAVNRRYNNDCRGAKERGLCFEISISDYAVLISRSCFYCGKPPVLREEPGTHPRKPLTANGLDRVNSSVGYTTANVVPCCWDCNRAKHTLSQLEFFRWIIRVHTYLTDLGLIKSGEVAFP
jgi:hypothetical protein